MDQANQDKEKTKITITLPTKAYFMSGIRDFTLSLIKNATQFSEKWAFRFQSVVDELCNNAIEHGSKPGEFITVNFIHNPEDSIEITVEDSGTGADKKNAKEITELVEKMSQPDHVFEGIRGRGLSKLVKEWTDELEFSDREEGGIKVKVKKYLRDARYESNALEKEQKIKSPTHILLND